MSDLRERVARFVIDAVEASLRVDEAVDAIISAVRIHATSNEAVHRAVLTEMSAFGGDEYDSRHIDAMRAAILAAL